MFQIIIRKIIIIYRRSHCSSIGRRGEDQYIWTAWFAWPLILVRMWNVLFADRIAMIPNIDVRDTLEDVTQVIWLVTHIMWIHNVHNAQFGVCLEEGIIHKKDLESPTRKGEEFIAVLCQSALIRRISRWFATYTLEPWDHGSQRSGMGLCCFGEGRG